MKAFAYFWVRHKLIMDSRLIYETSKHLKSKIQWKRGTESEWIYCGSKGEEKFEIVLKFIRDHFADSKLYVVVTRNDSFESDRKNIFGAVKDLIGVYDIFIGDIRIERVIELNKTGVFREGEFVAPVTN